MPHRPPPRPQYNPAQSHPAFLPVRVHVSAAGPPAPPAPPAKVPSPPAQSPRPQQHQWADPSQVSPAWEGWGRGPAEANVGKSRL